MSEEVSSKTQKEPQIFTLCDHCNKEFEMNFGETRYNFTAVFATCPHCRKVMKRWLRIPKRFEGLVDALRLLRRLPSTDVNLSWNEAIDTFLVLLDAKEQKKEKQT